jgi:hypothetical protein
MTRRQYLQSILHDALLTTVAQGINVRKTFVLSQHKNYPKPYAKAEIMPEAFSYERDEGGNVIVSSFDADAHFGIYAGVGIPTQDTEDGALLEQENDRVAEILVDAIHAFEYTDAVLDNGAELVIRNVYITGLIPAILDNEMTGNLLIEGVIEYSQNPP